MRTAILYNFLLEANITASIAILLMMLVRKLLRKPLGNSAISFGWLLIALRLLLPISLPNPFIYAIRTPNAPDMALRPIAGQVQVRLTDLFEGLSGGRMDGGSLIQQTAHGLREGMLSASLPITLFKVYLAGVLVVLAFFLVANIRFRRRLVADRIEAISGALKEDYLALCKDIKAKPLPVYLVDPLPSACLVGVLRPFIALPLTVSPKDAMHVLRHEMGHYQNKDQWFGVLRLLCCALHWFNPLVWLGTRMSYTDSEMRCDERVSARMDAPQKEAYANVLVLSAARHNAPGILVMATGMTQTHKKLKARVLAIVQHKKPLRLLSIGFVLVACVLLLGAYATHEANMSPRLNLPSPAVKLRDIQGDEEALVYAKELLGRRELGLNLEDHLAWEVIKHPQQDGEYIVAAHQPGGDKPLYSVSFDLKGRLLFLSNHDNSWEGSIASSLHTFSEHNRDALGQDLMHILRLINPEEAVKASKFTSSIGRARDDIYINYVFIDHDEDFQYGTESVVSMDVQIAPVVRLIRINFKSNPIDGNGSLLTETRRITRA